MWSSWSDRMSTAVWSVCICCTPALTFVFPSPDKTSRYKLHTDTWCEWGISDRRSEQVGAASTSAFTCTAYSEQLGYTANHKTGFYALQQAGYCKFAHTVIRFLILIWKHAKMWRQSGRPLSVTPSCSLCVKVPLGKILNPKFHSFEGSHLSFSRSLTHMLKKQVRNLVTCTRDRGYQISLIAQAYKTRLPMYMRFKTSTCWRKTTVTWFMVHGKPGSVRVQ